MRPTLLQGVRQTLSHGALAIALLAGCATSTSKTTELRLGMKKDSVVDVLGKPEAARGAVRNKFNQVIEVWQFTLSAPSKDSAGMVAGKAALTVLSAGMGAATFRGERQTFWLYFLEDELVQWGQAGDWDQAQKTIYEVQFNRAPKL